MTGWCWKDMQLSSVLSLEDLFSTLRRLELLEYKRMFVITLDEYYLPLSGRDDMEQVMYAYIEIWDDYGQTPVYSKRVRVTG